MKQRERESHQILNYGAAPKLVDFDGLITNTTTLQSGNDRKQVAARADQDTHRTVLPRRSGEICNAFRFVGADALVEKRMNVNGGVARRLRSARRAVSDGAVNRVFVARKHIVERGVDPVNDSGARPEIDAQG